MYLIKVFYFGRFVGYIATMYCKYEYSISITLEMSDCLLFYSEFAAKEYIMSLPADFDYEVFYDPEVLE